MPVTLTCGICGNSFSVIPSRVAKGAKYCSYRCHQIGEGSKGGHTTGHQKKAKSTGKSYIKLNGRHLHRQVAERMVGRPLRRGEIVHHRDGNKHNNTEGNLAVTTQSEHIRAHYPEMYRKRMVNKTLNQVVAHLQAQRAKNAQRVATSAAATLWMAGTYIPQPERAFAFFCDETSLEPIPSLREGFVFTFRMPRGAKAIA